MLSQTKNVFVTHSRLLTELERNRKPFLSVVMACVLKLFAVTNGSVFSLHLNSRRRFHRRFNAKIKMSSSDAALPSLPDNRTVVRFSPPPSLYIYVCYCSDFDTWCRSGSE